MRAIVQRVLQGSVTIDEHVVARIDQGFVVLVAAHVDDVDGSIAKMATRLINLRIFNDDAGKMNLAITDIPCASILLVPNFTVYGDTAASRRPSFTKSAKFEDALIMFNQLTDNLKALGINTQTGIFGANMQVSLVNDGPVTVIVET